MTGTGMKRTDAYYRGEAVMTESSNSPGFGRAAQSAIYRDGVTGRMPGSSAAGIVSMVAAARPRRKR